MFIDIEKWQEIFNTLRRHKLRTALTAFGVFWGIFMLTVLLGAGKGLENGVAEGFPKTTNTVWIWQQGTTQIPFQGMPTGRAIGLKPEDVQAIAKNVASVGFITGQNSVGVWDNAPPFTVRKARNGAFSIQGGFAAMDSINSVRIIQGRSFNPLDEQQKRKVAVIGQRVRDQLFAKDENPLGEDLTINGITFQVIGVFRSTQNGNQQQEEERIYLPNDTLRYAFNQIGRIGSFVIVPKPGIHARVTENDVRMYLSQINKVSPDDQGGLRQLQPAGRTRQGAGPVHRHQGIQLAGRHRHHLRGRRGRRKHHADRGEGTHARDRPAQGAGRNTGLHRRHDHAGVGVHHRGGWLQRPGGRHTAARIHRQRAERGRRQGGFHGPTRSRIQDRDNRVDGAGRVRAAGFTDAGGQGRRRESHRGIAG